MIPGLSSMKIAQLKLDVLNQVGYIGGKRSWEGVLGTKEDSSLVTVELYLFATFAGVDERLMVL